MFYSFGPRCLFTIILHGFRGLGDIIFGRNDRKGMIEFNGGQLNLQFDIAVDIERAEDKKV